MNEGICVAYTNTVEDMVAFNMHHLAHSPASRRIRFWSTWGIALVIVLIGAVASLVQGSSHSLVLVCAWAAVYLAFTIPYYRWAVRRRIRKLVGEGENRSFLCRHTVRLTDEGLHAESEVSEGKILWAGIERIAENDDYLFIYTGAAIGLVIPKARIESGDLASLTEELRRNVGPAADGGPR